MIVPLVFTLFVLSGTVNGGECTVRLHRSGNCNNMYSYERAWWGDVLKEWTSSNDLLVSWTAAGGGWALTNNDLAVPNPWAKVWEDNTVSFSYSGDCISIEMFDEDQWSVNCDETSKICLPSKKDAASWGVIGYGHNCKVYGKASGNERIGTHDECYYACNSPNGCAYKTAGCVQFRSDIMNDLLGFYMIPVKEEMDYGIQNGSMTFRNVYTSVTETFEKRNLVIVGVAAVGFLALGALIASVVRGKRAVENDFVNV